MESKAKIIISIRFYENMESGSNTIIDFMEKKCRKRV